MFDHNPNFVDRYYLRAWLNEYGCSIAQREALTAHFEANLENSKRASLSESDLIQEFHGPLVGGYGHDQKE